MALSIFDNKTLMPDDEMLNMVLGSSKTYWDNIKQNIPNLNTEWKFYGKEAGWTLNVKNGKRTLFVLIPFEGWFQVNFTLGEKAALTAKNSDLPKEVILLVPNEKQCVCGYGFRFDVKTKENAVTVKKLVEIKDKS